MTTYEWNAGLSTFGTFPAQNAALHVEKAVLGFRAAGKNVA